VGARGGWLVRGRLGGKGRGVGFAGDDDAGFFDGGEVEFFGAGPIDGVIPGIGGGADAEEFDGLGGDAAFGEVIAGELAGGLVGETMLPALGELFVDIEQLVLEVAGLLGAGGVFEFEGDFGALGEAADGVHEADVFVFLEEGEDVAALVAAETVEDLLLGIDVETGGFFLVEGAEGGEVGAGLFQGQVGADDIHDVIGYADPFASGGGKETGHAGRGLRSARVRTRAW
jgi:hypothetical protein